MLAGGTISSKNNFTVSSDAFITTTEPTQLVFDSPAFPFPGQVNYQVLDGSLDSLDNTQTWTSIFDQQVMTGCVIPEPITLTLTGMSLGLIGGLMWFRRRAQS
jgi:hypothetical protein